VVTPTANNGIKLELFVFDVFPMMRRVRCFAVKRNAQFAPVKNASGPGVADSPATAAQAISDFHTRRYWQWLASVDGWCNLRAL
jgi:UDP-N-acetylglucosamine/UDP-N-acetylgalactosamine diphosphorylase